MQDGALRGGETQPLRKTPEALATTDEQKIDENVYARIVEAHGLFGLFVGALLADRRLILPRVLRHTLHTMFRAPAALLMPAGALRDRYVFDTVFRWARTICQVSRVKLEVRGLERLPGDRCCLFAANHRSPMDIPVLYAALPRRAGFVANGIFAHLPIFSFWMRMSGAVFVQRGDPAGESAALKRIVRRLRRGTSLVIFPEGQIHQGPGLGEFRRGGLRAAALAGVPIVPVRLTGTDEAMRPGALNIIPYRRIRVEFGTPIETASLSRAERASLEARVRERLLALGSA